MTNQDITLSRLASVKQAFLKCHDTPSVANDFLIVNALNRYELLIKNKIPKWNKTIFKRGDRFFLTAIRYGKDMTTKLYVPVKAA